MRGWFPQFGFVGVDVLAAKRGEAPSIESAVHCGEGADAKPPGSRKNRAFKYSVRSSGWARIGRVRSAALAGFLTLSRRRASRGCLNVPARNLRRNWPAHYVDGRMGDHRDLIAGKEKATPGNGHRRSFEIFSNPSDYGRGVARSRCLSSLCPLQKARKDTCRTGGLHARRRLGFQVPCNWKLLYSSTSPQRV